MAAAQISETAAMQTAPISSGDRCAVETPIDSAGALPIPLEGRKMRWHIGAAEIIGGASAAR